ncbi:MAG: hypothetical protein ND895_11085 [Pyrinomonadaceae bacterium]|nr:hypothetical protein [Pyrinomonadaceae bacterium]
MSVTSSKLLYYLIRACLALLGLFLMTASVFSIFYPDIVHSESSRSYLRDVTLMVYGGALLVPFRWLRRSFLFPLALLIFTLGVMWAVYASLPGVVGFIQGRKSWLILPVSAIFLVLAVIAPAALIMRRRLDVVK